MLENPVELLLIDDEPDRVTRIREGFAGGGLERFEIVQADTLEAGLARAARGGFEGIFVSAEIPGIESEGFERVRAAARLVPVIALVRNEETMDPASVLRAGANDCLLDEELTRHALQRALRNTGEQIRLETELSESQTRFNDIAEIATDWLWETDEQFRLTFVSEHIGEFTAFDPSDAIGRTRWEFAGNPEERDRWENHRADLEAHRPFRDFRYSSTDKSGATHHFSVSGKPVFGPGREFRGYRGAGTNITAEVEAMNRIRQAEARLRSITENNPGVIFRAIRRADGRFDYPYISAGIKAVIGYDRDRLMEGDYALFRAPHEVDAERFFAAVERSARDLSPLEIEYRTVAASGEVTWVREVSRPHRNDEDEVVWDGRMLNVTAQKRAEEKVRLQAAALEAAGSGIVIADRTGSVVWVNPAFARISGYAPEEVVGHDMRSLGAGPQPPDLYEEMWQTITASNVWSGEVVKRRKDGTPYTEDEHITPIEGEDGEVSHFIAIKHDITERKNLEAELARAQKLESVGQLAAGIAHEINTPTQFVSDNVRFVRDAFGDLACLENGYRALLAAAAAAGIDPQVVQDVESAREAADVGYLMDEVPSALEQALEGTRRISKIVSAMKEFSHPGGREKEPVDLNRLVDTTVNVASNEWRYVAEVKTDLATDLPPVPCLRAELGQVILNLIVNATHAIADVPREPGVMGTIRVETRHDGETAEIRISDTGTGIPEEVRDRIFDPFFTTKEVGKGTGQGLSIAHSLVVEQHRGTLSFETVSGKGTTFVVSLPLVDVTPTAAESAA